MPSLEFNRALALCWVEYAFHSSTDILMAFISIFTESGEKTYRKNIYSNKKKSDIFVSEVCRRLSLFISSLPL